MNGIRMDNLIQNRFIHKIKNALDSKVKNRSGRPDLFPEQANPEDMQRLKTIKTRTMEQRRALLDRLTEQATPLNLKVIAVKDASAAAVAIAMLVQEKEPEWGENKRVTAWKHPLIEKLNLPDILARQDVPVDYTSLENAGSDAESVASAKKQIRRWVIDSYIGVTSADFCVADTATLVMKTRPGQARSVSLVPSIHVAVITIEQLLTDLKELYTLLKWDPAQKAEGLTNCMTFITGPSKTADIELVMVHGAHGPRELYLFVITG